MNFLSAIPSPHDAAIEVVLRDERYFGDGEPTWIIGEGKTWERPSQSAAEACEMRERAVKRLVWYGWSDITLTRIAQQLDSCMPGHRCGNGACPECTRALQRWLVESVMSADLRRPMLFSLVPDYLAFDLNRSNSGPKCALKPTRSLGKCIDLVTKHMAQAGIQSVIAGYDLSVNKKLGPKPFIQGQAWGLLERPHGDAWRAKLKALVNATGFISKPLRVESFMWSKASVAYGLKNKFKERNSVMKETLYRETHWNTRDKNLSVPDWLRVVRHLDALGLEGRLIERNAIFYNDEGQPEIALGASDRVIEFGCLKLLKPKRLERKKVKSLGFYGIFDRFLT